MGRHGDWLATVLEAPPEATLDAIIAEVASTGPDIDGLETALRTAKARAALLIALADLGGVWDLTAVTSGLSRLADAAVEHGAKALLAREIARGALPGLDESALGHGAGYVILAMGKLGAYELNYSSDIDLIALFDDALFDRDDRAEARSVYIRITRDLVALLGRKTAGGYVFRTDLRLRPSPSSNPVCIAMTNAERYYRADGRTWERAAFIKARPLVDMDAGRRFLLKQVPFVWRRHLDFAAVEDTHMMLRKIRAQKASFTVGALPGHDLKLGPGGIREIEFFAQTRQLIQGGRDASLRDPTTLGALDALADAGLVATETAKTLSEDYIRLRNVEHRIQMVEDAQTHDVPKSAEGRKRIAFLDGINDVEEFDADLATLLGRVHRLSEELYAPVSTPKPTLEDARSEATHLDGYENPEAANALITRWRDGRIAATRNERARDLYRRVEHRILEDLARAANPDQALVHFDRFLSGLPAGVQVFSLFVANPELLDAIVEICSTAPRLAVYLGRHPLTIDAMLDREFWTDFPPEDVLLADLNKRLSAEPDYEAVLDATRRWSREGWFRISVQMLMGESDHRASGLAFSATARAVIAALLPHVTAEFARRHGPPPGRGMAVLAMGKLGSNEMTARSDLDLITIYDPDGAAESEGPKPLATRIYYTRLTKALVAALSAPTAEGALYEVDMRLRPSGTQGPVAVSLEAFERYHHEGAWVWEHLALTRASLVAGPPGVRAEISRIARSALARHVGQTSVVLATDEMRNRLKTANAAEWDNPWALKLAAGGILDIELLTHAGMLFHGDRFAFGEGSRRADDALQKLVEESWVSPSEAIVLRRRLSFLQALQHIERASLDRQIDPASVTPDIGRVLSRAVGLPDFDAVRAELTSTQREAAEICEGVFARRTV